MCWLTDLDQAAFMGWRCVPGRPSAMGGYAWAGTFGSYFSTVFARGARAKPRFADEAHRRRGALLGGTCP